MPNHELLKESDRTQVQSQSTSDDSIFAKIAREAYVLGVGTVGGAVKEGWHQAVEDPWGSGLKLASSVGIGLALGYAQRGAGVVKLGGQALGAAFGISFMTDVMAPRRWNAIKDTMSDTWTSGRNLDRNLAVMENNLGRFGFDTAMMLGGGMAGAKLGQGLHGKSFNFNLKPVDPKLSSALSMAEVRAPMDTAFLESSRLGTLHADVKDPWRQAEGVLKQRKGYALEELDALKVDLLVRNDAAALGHKAEVGSIALEGAAVKGDITKLNQDLTQSRRELKLAQELTAETQALKKAEQDVEALKSLASPDGIAAKRTELEACNVEIANLSQAKAQAKDQAKEKAKEQGDGGKGAKGDGKDKGKGKEKGKDKDKGNGEALESKLADLKDRARQLRDEIAQNERDVDNNNPESAITKARVRKANAETALQEAKVAQPARVEAINARIAGIEQTLAGKQQAHETLGGQLRTGIEAYERRVDELKKQKPADDNTPAASSDSGVATQAKAPKPARSDSTTAKVEIGNGAATDPLFATGVPITEAARAAQTKAVEPGKGDQSGAVDSSGKLDHSQYRHVQAKIAEVDARTVEPGKGTQTAGSDVTAETSAGAKPAEVKAADRPADVTPVDKKVAEVQSPEVLAQEKADGALTSASESVSEYKGKRALREQARDQKAQALKDIREIEGGKRNFEDEAAQGKALEDARTKLAQANDMQTRAGQDRYFQTMARVRDYAKAVEQQLTVQASFNAKDAVTHLEGLLRDIPSASKGAGSQKDLPTAYEARNLTSERRLSQIREHLDQRLAEMDHNHQHRIKGFADQPLVQEALGKVTSGSLKARLQEIAESTISQRIPAERRAQVVADATKALFKETTIDFFVKGRLGQASGHDGKMHSQTVYAARYAEGQGRLDRFVGQTPDGYTMNVPKLRPDGTLMPIFRDGKPSGTYAKTVMEVGGKIPDVYVLDGTGEIMRSRDGKPRVSSIRSGVSLGEVIRHRKGEPKLVEAEPTAKPAEEASPEAKAAVPANTGAVATTGEAVVPAELVGSGAGNGTGSAYEAVAPKVEAPAAENNGHGTDGDASVGQTETAPEYGN